MTDIKLYNPSLNDIVRLVGCKDEWRVCGITSGAIDLRPLDNRDVHLAVFPEFVEFVRSENKTKVKKWRWVYKTDAYGDNQLAITDGYFYSEQDFVRHFVPADGTTVSPVQKIESTEKME